MKKALGQILVTLTLIASSASCLAGGGSEMAPAHRYEHQLNTISMMEAQTLVGKEGVYFFDVNTLELWLKALFQVLSTSTLKIGKSCSQQTKMQSWCFIAPTASVMPVR